MISLFLILNLALQFDDALAASLNFPGVSLQSGDTMLAGQVSNSTNPNAFGISPVSLADDGWVFAVYTPICFADCCARTYYVVLQAGQISFRAALDTGMKVCFIKTLHVTTFQVLLISGLLQRNALPVHARPCQDTPSPMPVPHLCLSTIMKQVSALATLMGLVCNTITFIQTGADGIARCIWIRC